MFIYTLLATDVEDVFGKVTPPKGVPGGNEDAATYFQTLFTTSIKLFIIVAAMVMLGFLLWGALDWILSSGDKEKVSKAQSKITNSIIGFVLIFVMLSIFGVVTGDILGVVQRTNEGGWVFALPTLGD